MLLHHRTLLTVLVLHCPVAAAFAQDRAAAPSPPAPCVGLVLITRGDVIKKVGDLPAPAAAFIKAQEGHDVAVGYKYSHFGVFWMALWTWGGEYVLYFDNTVYDLTEQQIGELLDKPVEKLGKPWQYRFPPGLIVVVVLVGLAVLFGRSDDSDQQAEAKRIAELFEDPRYQRALEIIEEDAEHLEDAGLSRAVNHLMSQGIPKTEAEENLAVMLHVIAEHGEDDEAGDVG